MIRAIIIIVLSVCAGMIIIGVLAARNPNYHGYDPSKRHREPEPLKVVVRLNKAASRKRWKKPLTMLEQLAKDNKARHDSRAERYHNGYHF